MRVEDEHGKQVRIHTNVDALEAEMLAAAPEDEKVIVDFTKAVRRATSLRLPIDKAPELMGLLGTLLMLVRLLPYLGLLKRWGSISAGDYGERCKSPLLRRT